MKIIDEFTDLPISKERKRQLRNIKKGLCWCGKEKVNGSKYRCAKHLIINRIRQRKKGNFKASTPNSFGRKPIIPDDYETNLP